MMELMLICCPSDTFLPLGRCSSARSCVSGRALSLDFGCCQHRQPKICPFCAHSRAFGIPAAVTIGIAGPQSVLLDPSQAEKRRPLSAIPARTREACEVWKAEGDGPSWETNFPQFNRTKRGPKWSHSTLLPQDSVLQVQGSLLGRIRR